MTTTKETSFLITVENRGGHNGVATGGHYGSWARVWASRPGVVQAEVVEEEHAYRPGRLAYHHDRVVVRVQLTSKFDHEADYLVVEHRRSANPYLRGSSRAESFELLAGVMPAWADFPRRWSEWIHEVRGEAVRYLMERASGDVQDAILYAARKNSKGNLISAWGEVARLLGIDPSSIPAGSWTSVSAMPVRIALRRSWRAPVPRPRYQKPEDSGRVLVAGPEGVL